MNTSQTVPAHRPTIAVLVPVAGAAVAVASMVWAGQPWRDGSAALDPFAVGMLGFALIPHVLVALGLVFGRAVGWLWWSALVYGVLSSAVGTYLDIEILTDDSSTAALGFLFLPAYQLLGMIPVAALAVVIGAGVQRRRHRGRTRRARPGLG